LTDTPSPDIYTLSLHDALPIYLFVKVSGLIDSLDPVECRERAAVRIASARRVRAFAQHRDDILRDLHEAAFDVEDLLAAGVGDADRKSTRLNSSHVKISYAVFC